MEKIAYIVPSQEVISIISHILEEDVTNGIVVPQMIDTSRIRSEYRRLCGEGYGAIIARGGTFMELMQVADSVTVLEVRVQTSDILAAICECREQYQGKIYVVIHRNIADSFEHTLSVFLLFVFQDMNQLYKIF
ncbi:MAG: PrpR N-terminal domain-containing protein [Clostridiales bacterium]|nr:PrpR N-terminal domain-containing protein [Clostridiales bacterium]